MCVHWCRSAFSMRLDNDDDDNDEDEDDDEEKIVGGRGWRHQRKRRDCLAREKAQSGRVDRRGL